MKLTNKSYDRLTFVARILLPALGTLVSAIAKIWGLPYGPETTSTIMAFDLFLNAILEYASKKYKKEGK